MEYAEASCVLKVNVHCQACKMKMMEVLGSICGIYNVDINSEEGLAKVYGVVDPNILLKALARTGYHAELKRVMLRHPKMNMNSYYHNDYDSSNYRYGYNNIHDPYPYSYPSSYYRQTALPEYAGHQYSAMGPSGYNGPNPYYYGSGLPPARYVPSYPPKEYDPYADEPITFCSIM